MIKTQYETQMCVFTLYEDGGKEIWHCLFKYDHHPVNKKFFKMSGQPCEK